MGITFDIITNSTLATHMTRTLSETNQDIVKLIFKLKII